MKRMGLAAALAACLGVTAAAASVPTVPSPSARKAPPKAAGSKVLFDTISRGDVSGLYGLFHSGRYSARSFVDNERNTPLHLAAERCSLDLEVRYNLIRYLISQGGDLQAKNKWGDTPAQIAKAKCGGPSVINLLLTDGHVPVAPYGASAYPRPDVLAQAAELQKRADALLAKGAWREAWQAYFDASRLDYYNAAVHNGMAVSIARLGNMVQAEAEAQLAAKFDPDNPLYRRNAEAAGRDVAAGQQQAQQVQAQNAAKKVESQQWIQRGDQLRASGAYDQAVQAYERAWHIDQTNAAAFFGEGIAYYQLKKYAMAEWGFQTALKYDPGNQAAQNNLQVTRQQIAAANQRFQQTYQRTMQERAQQQQRDKNAEFFNTVTQGLALGQQIGQASRPPSRPAAAPPQSSYSPAPRQYATAAPPPSASPSGAGRTYLGPVPTGCVALEKNAGGSFWSVVNNCPAAVIGNVCFDNDKTFNCGTQTPAGYGPIRPGGRESIYGPSASATGWHTRVCYYDDYIKGGCSPR